MAETKSSSLSALLRYLKKHPLITFFLLTYGMSSVLWVYFIVSLHTTQSLWTLLLMYIPGIAGLCAQKIHNQPLKNLGWKRPSLKIASISYFLPALVAILVAITLLASGFATYVQPQKWWLVIFVAPILNMIPALIAALGEEIGWRGYLYLQIPSAKKRILISGIMWSAWHWPLLYGTDYGDQLPLAYSISVFTLNVLLISWIMDKLRTSSQSLWTAAILHGSHNLWIQGISQKFLHNDHGANYLGGEFGIITSIFYLALGLCLHVFSKKLRQSQQ